MGRLAKQRKRERSRNNTASRPSRPQQGGRFKAASSILGNTGTRPLLNDVNSQKVQQQQQSQTSTTQNQSSLFSQISAQEEREQQIRNAQRERKRQKIQREFEELKRARNTIQNSNLSDTAKQQLFANFEDKEERLNQDLAGLTPGASAAARRAQQIRQLEKTIEQQRFTIRQEQGRSGERQTTNPVAGSLATTPGSAAKVRSIAAKLNLNLASLAQLRREQQSETKGAPSILNRQNAFDIPQPTKNAVTPLGFGLFAPASTTAEKQGPPVPAGQSGQQQQTKQDDPLRDIAEGFTAPFFNLGKIAAAVPEAVQKDVERFQQTGQFFEFRNPFNPDPNRQESASDQFFREEVAPNLQRTSLDALIEGKPTGRSPTFDAASAAGEIALIAAPFVPGARAPKPVVPKGPAAKPQSQAPTIESIAKGVVEKPNNTKQKQNRNPGPNVFRDDTAEPSFVRTLVQLGKGTTRTPEGGTFPTFGFGSGGGGPKGRSGGGKSTKPRTFDDPKPEPGSKILDNAGGLLQIQKAKTAAKKKKTKQQQTSSQQFLEQQVRLGFGEVKQVKNKSTSKSLLDNPFPKTKQKKKKSQAAITTEQFFLQQEKSAKKRRERSIFAGLIDTKQGQSGKLTPKTTQKQSLSLLSKLANPTKPRRPQSTITRLAQQPFTAKTTTPVASFLNPTRTPPPVRGVLGGGFLPFIPGGGGGGGPRGRGGRFSKRFLVSSLDPTRAGVIAAADVPDLLSGRTSEVFSRGDKALRKARNRKNASPSIGDILSNPFGTGRQSKKKNGKSKKGKTRRKSLLDDPFANF